MRGFIDLHCHWVVGVDDGAKTHDDAALLLGGLRDLGFDVCVATPHMRPGMFDNTASDLRGAYDRSTAVLSATGTAMPELALASEHFFDDIVFQRLVDGAALPYPGARAVLVEFGCRSFPARVADRFFDLRRKHLRPVLAHPERYQPVWRDPRVLDPLVNGGAVLLLDVAALVGRYGREPRRVAQTLLEKGYYYAACSDAHCARDLPDVERGIDRLFAEAGDEGARFLLRDGPRNILDGQVDT